MGGIQTDAIEQNQYFIGIAPPYGHVLLTTGAAVLPQVDAGDGTKCFADRCRTRAGNVFGGYAHHLRCGISNDCIPSPGNNDHVLRLVKVAENHVQLTPLGLRRAAELTKTHRLWETYLMQQANIAADHVDRDADETEHLLPEAVRLELEQQLEEAGRLPRAIADVPQSPHELEPPPEPKDQKTHS